VKIGAHVSIAGGLERALERGAEVGCDVVQIFSRSNQQWAARPIDAAALAAWRAARTRTGVEPAMVHACYLLNLASPRRWLREKSIRALAEELARCALLASRTWSSTRAPTAATARRPGWRASRPPSSGPTPACRTTRPGSCSRTRPGRGAPSAIRFEHLRDIIGAMKTSADRIGVCIDTAHTIAAGFDIATEDGWQRTFEHLEAAVGCHRVAAFTSTTRRRRPARGSIATSTSGAVTSASAPSAAWSTTPASPACRW
jgi:deoxyribonuclease-4